MSESVSEDDFFSPDSAVARLNADDRAWITAEAQKWLEAKKDEELVDLPFMAFLAGAAWSALWRWE